jgi:hypothetical protein
MALKGLTLHEICHILFTPRNATTFRRIVAKEKLEQVFHIAEDSRVETLLIGRFGMTITAWLNATMFRHLLTPELDLSLQFPQVAGRKYLPLQLRQSLRDVYCEPQHADEIESLLDEYRLMVFTTDDVVMRALEILRRLNDLLKLPISKGNGTIPSPNGHHNRPGEELEPSSSRPLSPKEQEQAKNAATRQIKPNSNGTKQTAPNKPIEPSSSNPNENGCHPTPTRNPGTKENTQGENDPNNSDNNTQGYSLDDPSKLTPALEQEINDLWGKELNKVKHEVSKDIKNFRNNPDLDDTRTAKPRPASYTSKTIDYKTLSAGKQFGVELERIKSELEPGWLLRQEAGKINANRYLTENDLEKVFDEWQDGREDATDIEAVILLDNSGSMSGANAVRAYKSMFAIKMGLQAIGANCSVIVYNNRAEMLYEADDLVKSTIRDAGADGGTDPLEALMYSQSVFANSQRKVKLLFSITDGEWGNTEQADEIISRLSVSGVITSIAIIGNDTDNTHNSTISAWINNPNDLIGLAKSIVKLSIQEALTK